METTYGTIDQKDVDKYLTRLTNRVFKILPMSEEGSTTVENYAESLAREIFGNSKLFYGDEMLCVFGTLNGLNYENHKALKSDILKACGIISSKTKKRGY